MTDRELLELAAKAAHSVGMKLIQTEAGPQILQRAFPDGTEMYRVWNPLTDDGDALRMAVKLNDFEPYRSHGGFRLSPGLSMADQRRAIVRAAAEIGRNM